MGAARRRVGLRAQSRVVRRGSCSDYCTTEDHCTVRSGWCVVICGLKQSTPMRWPSAERSKTARPTHRLTGRATTSRRDRSRHRSRTGPPSASRPRPTSRSSARHSNWSSTRQASARSSFSISSLFAIAERSSSTTIAGRHPPPVDGVRRDIGRRVPQRPDNRGVPAAVHRSRLGEVATAGRTPALSIGADPLVWRSGSRRPSSPRSRGSCWLEYCTGAGQLLGYATGPGDSPGKLH